MPRAAWPTEGLVPVSDVLRNARTDAGLTQAEVAQRLGVSMKQVGGWEGGERIVPAHLIGALGAMLGLAPGELGRRVDAAARGFHTS